MAPEQHTWTEEELRVVCICYKEKLPIELALRLTNTTNELIMRMRYQNCLYLDKGPVENALSHASKTLVKVWEEVDELYENIEPLGLTVAKKEEESYILETALAVLFVVYFTIMLNALMM